MGGLAPSGGVQLAVHSDAKAAAAAAARFIAEQVEHAVSARGSCSLACSGGNTPLPMFEQLAQLALPWQRVQVFQVDERVVALDDPNRNARQLQRALLERVPLPPGNVCLMPVERPSSEAATRYAKTLRDVLGQPAVFDLVHLGLGDDGHTASLVPGDPALEVIDTDVASVGEYRGHQRLTLTFPALNRARSVLWLVCGAGKQRPLKQLLAGDTSIPAGRVRCSQAEVFADSAAVGA